MSDERNVITEESGVETKPPNSNDDPQQGGGKKLSSLKKFFQSRAKGNGSSSMRYNPFSLFTSKATALFDGDLGSGEVFKEEEYTLLSRPDVKLKLRRRCENNTTASDVRKAKEERIDNTGNFHWPAEEILAHVMSTHLVNQKSEELAVPLADSVTLEIGSGFGLAGFFLAKLLQSSELGTSGLVITDGNSGVVRTAQKNVELVRGQNNCSTTTDCPASSSLDASSVELSAALLRWDSRETYAEYLGRTRRIIGADVLFFEDFHDALVTMVLDFIIHGSVGIKKSEERSERSSFVSFDEMLVVAPSRGKSLQRWVEKMRSGLQTQGLAVSWNVSVHDNFDTVISRIHDQEAAKSANDPEHSYSVDRHQPLLVKVHRVVSKS